MKTYRKTFFFKRGVPYRLNQQIMPRRSEYIFFSVLAVTLQKMINTSKQGKKYLNKFYRHIVETIEKNFMMKTFFTIERT